MSIISFILPCSSDKLFDKSWYSLFFSKSLSALTKFESLLMLLIEFLATVTLSFSSPIIPSNLRIHSLLLVSTTALNASSTNTITDSLTPSISRATSENTSRTLGNWSLLISSFAFSIWYSNVAISSFCASNNFSCASSNLSVIVSLNALIWFSILWISDSIPALLPYPSNFSLSSLHSWRNTQNLEYWVCKIPVWVL